MQNLLAGWYYCAYEPSDVGSVAYVESGSDEVLSAAERSAAFDKALDTCVEAQRLGGASEQACVLLWIGARC